MSNLRVASPPVLFSPMAKRERREPNPSRVIPSIKWSGESTELQEINTLSFQVLLSFFFA